MRKFTLSMIAMLAFMLTSFNLQAQQRELLYEDDFESYAVDDFIAQSNPEMWTTWSNLPGGDEDAQISDEQAYSGTKSIKVDGISDLVLKMGNKTSGRYILDFEYYVPSTFGAYYNLQHYESPGVEWALEVYFATDGTGSINAGGEAAATFNYNHDEWIYIANVVDLDADWAELYIDDVLIYEWQFSLQATGEVGMLQLGGANFYAGAPTGETPTYYLDDISFDADNEQILYYNEFDEYTPGDYIAVVDPDWWTTWSNTPGTAEDALIVNEQSSSPENSIKVDGTSDLVFKMGNKTSGKYILDFEYYVPSTFGAYYNLQHYESPGVEWALEVYFATDGTGSVNAGGEAAATFNYNHDEWIEITNVVDLDADLAQLFIDEVLIYEWQFSLQATGEPGMLQLGAANFYAGAPTGETPTYYLDDLAYVSLVQPALGPIIDIDDSEIISSLESGEMETINRSLTNAGDMPLTYDVVASFDEPLDARSTSPWVSTTPIGKFNDTPAYAPNYTPGNNTAPANRDAVLNYDGDNASAIGSPTAAQWRVAAMFPASMVAQYNGMYVEAVDVFINEVASAHKIQIYDMGSINLPGPGALLYEQDFTALATSWNHIVLTTPVYVSGRDLWVGYRFNKPAEVYPAGVDAGPANPNGDWLATGPGWGHLSDNPELDANWNIRAMLVGDGGPVWLSVNPNQGVVEEPGASDILAIEVNTADLTPANYSAKLHVRSNDPTNEQIDITVMLTIITGLNEAGEQTYVTVYPNPANDVLFLKGNTDIKSITLSNSLGQVVYENVVGQRDTRIATSGFESGMYILTIQTQSGIATQKIMIQ